MVPMPSMIRHLDVTANPLRAVRAEKPYLVCVQHNLLQRLNFRVMAPLVIRRAGYKVSRLYPAIGINDTELFFDPTDLLTLPLRLLKAPGANLDPDRDRIVAALDLVFTGT